MKDLIKIFVVALISLASLSSCKKVDKAGNTPEISFESVNTQSVKQFSDSLVIAFSYKDENGDLGEFDPDKNSLMIRDRRLDNPDYYFLKPLAPGKSVIRINGIVNIRVKNTFLLGTGLRETSIFDIRLRDREGNWSNTISTPEIEILK